MNKLIDIIKRHKLFSITCCISLLNTTIYSYYNNIVSVYAASFLSGIMLGYLWYFRKEILKTIIKE